MDVYEKISIDDQESAYYSHSYRIYHLTSIDILNVYTHPLFVCLLVAASQMVPALL